MQVINTHHREAAALADRLHAAREELTALEGELQALNDAFAGYLRVAPPLHPGDDPFVADYHGQIADLQEQLQKKVYLHTQLIRRLV